jgi:hypothetical protein
VTGGPVSKAANAVKALMMLTNEGSIMARYR